MSKSLGNFFTIDDVLEREFAPQALRLLFLMSHYRSELNFTWDNLAGAHKTWLKLRQWLTDQPSELLAQEAVALPSSELAQQFVAALEDDLKTPEAMAIFWEVFKSREILAPEKLQHLLAFDQYLGLGLGRLRPEAAATTKPVPAAVQQLLDQRAQARNAKDWTAADQLRLQLVEAGFEVTDQPDGTQSLRPI